MSCRASSHQYNLYRCRNYTCPCPPPPILRLACSEALTVFPSLLASRRPLRCSSLDSTCPTGILRVSGMRFHRARLVSLLAQAAETSDSLALYPFEPLATHGLLLPQNWTMFKNFDSDSAVEYLLCRTTSVYYARTTDVNV